MLLPVDRRPIADRGIDAQPERSLGRSLSTGMKVWRYCPAFESLNP
jgi:hypothetical protein